MNFNIHKVQEVLMTTRTSEDGETHWRDIYVRDAQNNEFKLTLFADDLEKLSIKI